LEKEKIPALAGKDFGDAPVPLSKIPDIDLYMDQIITLYEQNAPREKTLTKTMINNYSKEKIIAPIRGKKYSREHVLQILLVCRLKELLSLQDVKTVMGKLSGPEGLEKERLESFYERYASLFETERAVLEHALKEILSACEGGSSPEAELLQLLFLSDLSAAFRAVAGRLIRDSL